MKVSHSQPTGFNKGSRPLKTQRVYEPCQLEFQRWCEAKDFPQETRTAVTPQKLATFLDEEVLNKTQRVRGTKRKHTDASGENTQQHVPAKKIGLSAVRIYVAAIVDLWQYQRNLGVNTYPSPRTRLVSRVLKEMERNEEGEKRAQFVDKVIGTMIDLYTSEEELESLVSYFTERNTEVGLRDAGSFLLSHYALLCGHYARELELLDMHSLLMPEEGYTDCHALLLIMRKGKANQFSRLEIGAGLRNKNVFVCPFAALAMYMVWRFHLSGETIPNFKNSEEWDPIKL